MPTYLVTTESGKKYRVTTEAKDQGVKDRGFIDSAVNLASQGVSPTGLFGVASKAFDEGAKLSDVPAALFRGASGALAGAPKNILENPFLAAAGGLPAVQANLFGEKERELPKFLKPKTQAGENFAGDLEFAGSLLPIETVLGGSAKILGGSLKAASKASKSRKVAENLKFLDEIENTAQNTRKLANTRFGEKLALADELASKSGTRPDLSEVSKFLSNTKDPKIKSLLRTVPELQDLVPKEAVTGFDPILLTRVTRQSRPTGLNKTITQIQNLSNSVGAKTRQAALEGRRVKFDDKDILKLRGLLKKAQRTSNDDVAKIVDDANSEFAEISEAFKLVQRKLKGDTLQKSVKGGFGEDRSREALRKLIGDDLMERIDKIAKSERFKRNLSKFGGNVVQGGVTGAILRLLNIGG